MFSIIVPEKYRAEDLPKNADGQVMAATFLSNEKNPSLRIVIENIEEEYIGQSGPSRKQGTGYMIRFSGNMFRTKNKALAEKLLKCDLMNAPDGFAIDHHDPSGLWRHLGVVKSVPIETFESVRAESGSLSNLADMIKKAPKEAPQPAKALVGLA